MLVAHKRVDAMGCYRLRRASDQGEDNEVSACRVGSLSRRRWADQFRRAGDCPSALSPGAGVHAARLAWAAGWAPADVRRHIRSAARLGPAFELRQRWLRYA